MTDLGLIALVSHLVSAIIGGFAGGWFVKRNERRLLDARREDEREQARRKFVEWADELEAGDYEYQREIESMEEAIDGTTEPLDIRERERRHTNVHRYAAARFQMAMAARLSRAALNAGRMTADLAPRVYEFSNALSAIDVVRPSVSRALEIVTEPSPSLTLTRMELFAGGWFHGVVDLLDPTGAMLPGESDK